MTELESRFPRRRILGLSFLALASSVVAACAPAAPPSPTSAPAATTAPSAPAATPTTASAAAPTSAPAATPTTAPQPAATTAPATSATEIRLGTWASAELLDVIKAQVADFQKRTPGATVKLETAPWQQYWDKMQIQVAGGTTPDVIWMSGATFLDLNAKNAFKDLASYAKSANVDLTGMWNEPIYTAGGKLWSIPYTASVHALFYNKTMLKEAGIAEPPTDWNAPGWTWDDLRQACLKLTGKDKNGQQRWGIELYNGMEWGWGTYTLSNGAPALNPDKSSSLMDAPAFIDTMQYIHDMIHKDKVSPVPGDPAAALGPNVIDLFQSGRVAFRNGNNSRLPSYIPIKDFEWDVCVPPRAAADKARKVYWVQNPYCMASASKTPDATWQLLQYFVSKPGQDFMGTAKIIMPSLRDAAVDPNTYLKPPPNNTKVFPDGMDKNFTTDLQFTKTWLHWQQTAQEQLDPVYTAEKPIADACKAAKQEVDKVLKTEQ
jgi:multiple sugar transport system substrate-binding protein